MKKVFRHLLSSQSEISSRRFIVLITALNFVGFCTLVMVFIAFFVFKPREFAPSVVVNVFELMHKLVDYMFFLIVLGFGFITASAFIEVLLARLRTVGILSAFSGEKKTTVQVTEKQTLQTQPNSVE
jgi:hypothetical protein